MNPTSVDTAGPLVSIAEQVTSDAPELPALPPEIPVRHGSMSRWVGRVGLALARWRIVGNFPNVRKAVVIVAPHTSNWDFWVGFSAYLALDLGANWFAKHTLFVGPVGSLMRHFGGIAIHRQSRAASQVVDEHAAEFERRERLILAIAPEGTRKKVAEWKSGFYRIAVNAEVPIIPVALDYRLRRIIIGPPFTPAGDWERDIVRIKALYAGVTPKYASQF